jgi:hypothetical protein
MQAIEPDQLLHPEEQLVQMQHVVLGIFELCVF